MPDAIARGAVAGQFVEIGVVKDRVLCRDCGADEMYRAFRQGYLQEKILPLFGFYPWRCKGCGASAMLRKRRRTKTKDYVE